MAFTAHETAYNDKGVELIPEFYADLEYDADGNLILSRVHDAVDPAKAAARVLRVMRDHAVTTTGRAGYSRQSRDGLRAFRYALGSRHCRRT